MKLGKFIENFSHNNVIRLVYEYKGGHETVLDTWDDVSMDWEINKQQGKFRHFINNEVLGIACIGGMKRNPEAINIVIEKLENQPFLEEVIQEKTCCGCCESISEIETPLKENKCDSELISEIDNSESKEAINENEETQLLTHHYWIGDEWKQPPVRIKHGDLVDVKCDNYPIMIGRYIGKGFGVVELYNYATGIKHVVGRVCSRGIDRNPRLISDENLMEFIFD